MILKPLSDEPLRPWETTILFPASHRIDEAEAIIVEIGPGRGDFLYHLAAQHPDSLVVAIEIKRKRIDRLAHRLQKRRITNVLLVQSDARKALPELFPPNAIDEIHINFPDPWPKKRHTKNRLMSEAFLEQCALRLKPGGTLHFATDQGWYAEETRERFRAVEKLSSCYPEGIALNPPHAFPTLFMEKWRNLGRQLHYQKYEKTA